MTGAADGNTLLSRGAEAGQSPRNEQEGDYNILLACGLYSETMGVNPPKHPVYDLLPLRTQTKILSPVSEDKLTWDCFFGLLRAGKLGTVLASLLKIPDESLKDARLVLWGFEIREDGAAVWEPLREVLSQSRIIGTESRRDRKRSQT